MPEIVVTEESARLLAAEALDAMLEGKHTNDILRQLDVSDAAIRGAIRALSPEAMTIANFTLIVAEALNREGGTTPMNAIVNERGTISVQVPDETGSVFDISIRRR